MSNTKIVSQDYVGKVFGRLTIIREFRRPIKTIPHKTELIWECRCKCGTIKAMRANSIKRGLIKSCGCLKTERVRTHNLSRSTEYRIWHGINQRTENPNNPSYANYGGRGITMYPEWRNSFEAFLAYVGPRPSLEHTIERIDNDKGYEPNNVKWDTRYNQNRNHRGNRMITFNGETMCIQDWAARVGVDIKTISYRLKKWPIEIALTAPNLHGKKLVNRSTHQFHYSS